MKKIKVLLVLMFASLLAFDANMALTIGAAGVSFLVGPDRVRALFNALKDIPGISLQESYLRQESTVVNTTGTFNFDFRKQTNSSNTTVEPQLQLLGNNDLFIATHVGVYLYEANTTTPGRVRGGLQTGVNPTYFTTTAFFTIDHLNQLYEGRLKFKVASTELMEAIDMTQFNELSPTQLGVNTTTGVAGPTFGGSRRAEQGIKDLSTFAVMDGSQDNLFIIECPIFNGIQYQNTGANLQNRLVLQTHGVLVKGGTRSLNLIKEQISLIS